MLETLTMSGVRMSEHECHMLGEIKTLMAELNGHMVHSREQTDYLKTLLAKHDEAINGNGKPGLKTRIKVLECHLALVWGGFVTGVGSLVWLGWESLRNKV